MCWIAVSDSQQGREHDETDDKLYVHTNHYLVLALRQLGWTEVPAVVAQGASVVFSIWKMKKDGLPFPVDRAHLRNNRPERLRIAHVGAPMAFQDLLISISFLIVKK